MKTLKSFYQKEPYNGIISVMNVDDIFIYEMKNVKKVMVDESEMKIIARFVLGNSANTNYGAEVMKTGRVDMFFGIKLVLIK